VITGEVSPYREAIVPLSVWGPDGARLTVDATLDTGFTEHLTLSPQIVAALGLVYEDTSRVVLADGRVEALYVYACTALWDGDEREILVYAAEGGCLLGMALLHGYEVRLQVVDGGVVTIEALG